MKSSKLKAIEGNPGKRELAGEADPPEGAPKLACELSDEAQLEYQRICGELHDAGLLFKTDRAYLELYMSAWQMMKDAERRLALEGLCIEVETQHSIKTILHPVYEAYKTAFYRMEQLLGKLGLNPNGRKGLSATPRSGNEDELAFDEFKRGA